MTEGQSTTRLGLPLMMAAQAQKEVTHNEALMLIDMVVAPLVEAIGDNDPPSAPVAGQQWIVGPVPTGPWTGQANNLAGWSEAGWRFGRMPVGSVVTERATMRRWRRNTVTWAAPVAVAAASGGMTIDSECRVQLASLIVALSAQGLLSD